MVSAVQAYCPDVYDIIWLELDPQAGREQAGRRPAFVLSPRRYNQMTRLCVVCPITSKVKGYPFEVGLPGSCAITGVIMSDQIKSVDWATRNAAYATSCPEVADDVHARLKSLLGL